MNPSFCECIRRSDRADRARAQDEQRQPAASVDGTGSIREPSSGSRRPWPDCSYQTQPATAPTLVMPRAEVKAVSTRAVAYLFSPNLVHRRVGEPSVDRIVGSEDLFPSGRVHEQRRAGVADPRRPALMRREVLGQNGRRPACRQQRGPAARSGRPSPATAEARALVSFTRGHAYRGRRRRASRTCISEIAGLRPIARDALSPEGSLALGPRPNGGASDQQRALVCCPSTSRRSVDSC